MCGIELMVYASITIIHQGEPLYSALTRTKVTLLLWCHSKEPHSIPLHTIGHGHITYWLLIFFFIVVVVVVVVVVVIIEKKNLIFPLL